MYNLQGKEIINHFLEILEDEGITSVPRWTPPDGCDLEEAGLEGADEEEGEENESSSDDEFEDAEQSSVGEGQEGVTMTSHSLQDKSEHPATADDDAQLGKDKEPLKREKKESSASIANKKERKKKDSTGSEGTAKKEEAEDKTKSGAIRKISLCKTESVTLEEGWLLSRLWHTYNSRKFKESLSSQMKLIHLAFT